MSHLLSFYTPARAVVGVNGEAPIYIIIGQSNAVGLAKGIALPSTERGTIAGIKIWKDSTEEFVALHFTSGGGSNTNLGNDSSSVGAEMTLGALLRDSGREGYILKYAVGGTSLETDWASPSGAQWVEFLSQYTAAMAEIKALGKTPVFRGVLWVQGERDAGLGGTASANYETNLTNFLATVRTLTGVADLKFCIVRLSPKLEDTPSVYPGSEDVRTAQAAVVAADSNTTLVETRFFTCVEAANASARIHYAFEGQRVIATEFFRFVHGLSRDYTDYDYTALDSFKAGIDFSDNTTFTINGSNEVTAMTNKSGASFAGSITVTGSPVYSSSGGGGVTFGTGKKITFGSAGDFNEWHDQTGATLFFIVSPTDSNTARLTLCSNGDTLTSNPSFHAHLDDRNASSNFDKVATIHRNDAGTNVGAITSLDGAYTPAQNQLIMFRLGTESNSTLTSIIGYTNEGWFRYIDNAATPSTSNSQAAATFFALAGGTNPFQGVGRLAAAYDEKLPLEQCCWIAERLCSDWSVTLA